MPRKRMNALLGGVAAFSLAGAFAQDDAGEASGEALRCLSMSSIRATRVLDDSRVLFIQDLDRAFVNRLDRECLGLLRSGSFTYTVQGGARHARLCSNDSITVLDTMGRGLNCGLGLFEPLSRQQAESLVGPMSPAELPKEEPPAPAAEPTPPR